jgi:DNA ligase-1
VEAGNWEGFMLRKDVPYQSGRTKDLLKIKAFMDTECPVIDLEIGEMSTSLPGKGIEKYEGVTALVVDYKGTRVGVGSGLSREQRIEWAKDPSKILGKEVCVKFFEETVNKNGAYSLRFPTLKYVYDGKRDT